MSQFTLRIYGLLVSREGRLLLSEEVYQNQQFTKFPGGGLQFGEGTRAALQREFQEEFGLDLQPEAHLHTTDFFVESAFHPGVQVVNVYYLMPKISEALFPLIGVDGQILHWVPLSNMHAGLLTFDTDRKAWEVFQNQIKDNNL